MRKFIYLYFTCFCFLLSCKNETASQKSTKEYSISSNSEEEVKSEIDGYKDGDYCAEINYYYSQTGTSSKYTLKVEIESNELVKIYWPNGGWLDNSHFNPPDISDGYARFESDRRVEYTVKIIGEDGDCFYSSNAEDEDDLVKKAEEETCPKCGKDKYSWKKLCNHCIDEIEEHTCKKCGKVDDFMFSTDDMCSDCEDELKEEEKRKLDEEN